MYHEAEVYEQTVISLSDIFSQNYTEKLAGHRNSTFPHALNH